MSTRTGAFTFGMTAAALLLVALFVLPRNWPDVRQPVDSRAAVALRDPETLDAGWVTHLEGVKRFDREIAAKHDLSPERIAAASTAELLTQASLGPTGTWAHLYGDPQIGVRRAIASSETVRTFVNREDVVDAFRSRNREANEEIKRASSRDDVASLGKLSIGLMVSDYLLQFPDVFKRCKGHERELIRGLCERHRLMLDANRRFGEARAPFGASFNTTNLSVLSLCRSATSESAWPDTALSDESAFFARVREEFE